MNADGSYSSGPLPPERPFALDENSSSRPSGDAPSSAVSPSTHVFNPNIPAPSPFSFQPSSNRPFSFVPPSTNNFSSNFSSPHPSSQPSSARSSSLFTPLTNTSKPDISTPRPSTSQQSGPRSFSFVAPSTNTGSLNSPGPSPSPSTSQTSGVRLSSFVPPSTSVFGPAVKLDQRRFSQPLSNESVGASQSPRLEDILSSVNRAEPYVTTAQLADTSLPNAISTPLFQLPPQQNNADEILFKAMPPGPAMRQHLGNPVELNRHIFLMEKREDKFEKEIQRQDRELSNLFLEGKKKDSVIDNAKAHIEEQNQTIDKQTQRIDENDSTIAELEQRCHHLEAKVGESNDRMSQLEGQLNQHVESEATKDKEIAEMKELRGKVEADVNDLTAQVSIGRAELAKANATHDDHLERLRAKDDEVAELQAINITAKEEIQAKVEEIAGLGATNSNLDAIIIKANEEIQAKDSRIAELERQTVDAEDIYKRLVLSHDQDEAKVKRDHEEKEAAIEAYRKSEDEMNTENVSLRRKIQEAEKTAKVSVSNMHESDERLEEHERTINGLQATIQRMKKEREKEKDNMKLKNDSDPEGSDDLHARIQRLKSEKQEIEDKYNSYIKTHGDDAKVVDAEYLYVQQAGHGLESDLRKVDQQFRDHDHIVDESWRIIQEHRQTIEGCQQEIQDLTEELKSYRSGETKKPVSSKGKANDSESDNGLSQLSGAQSLQGTPESWPARWRPRTESMYGDSDDDEDHDHDITITQPATQGLGIAAPDMCDHETQTDAPSSPMLGISKPVVIAEVKPSAPDMYDQGTETDIPSPVPKSGISKLFSSNNWSAAPDMKDHGTQANSPSLRSKFSFSEPVYLYDTPTAADMCEQGTQTDVPSSKFGISILTTTINTAPSSAAVPATPHKQPLKESQSRWRWLWYLLMLLVIAIAIFAAFYGESARREREMWLKANDFTRRAVISVRAGGGSGTSMPAWLWKDPLLDLSMGYYGGQYYGLLGRR
ncbi:MAG: hypothetical protein Q9186_002680 [Xanthomendoza sp. 1 TL-2023]